MPNTFQQMPTIQKGANVCFKRRRQLLQSTALVLLHTAVKQQQASAAEQAVLEIGPSKQFQTIGAALAVASAGSTLLIQPGRYQEKLEISKSVKLIAAQQGAVTELLWETSQPYEHCLAIPSGSDDIEVFMQGLQFRHASMSVANNYCIYTQAGQTLLAACDIRSRTGVGVAAEGASLQLSHCTVHGCERHGVAVFGSLDGVLGKCQLQDCCITTNKFNGVLAKDGVQLKLQRCQVQANGGYGLYLQDGTVTAVDSSFLSNGLGPVAMRLDSDSIESIQQLQQENKLNGEVKLL